MKQMKENNKKRKVGRPRKWETREELIEEINDYLDKTDFDEYSITGLALTLGTSRQTLDNYQEREEFKDIIEEAKLIVENSYELSLRKRGKTGDIFALKNFGWKDKQDIDMTTKGDKLETGGNVDVDKLTEEYEQKVKQEIKKQLKNESS